MKEATMNKSDSINEIAIALSAVQGEIKDVHKEKSGYGYKYADLSQVLDIARPLLHKHGLAITQLCGSADEKVTVETVLMHTSGQWLSGTIEMLPEKGKGRSSAQDVGAVISYARRYALAAIIGVTQTDNDAAAGQDAPREEASVITSQQAQYVRNLLAGDDDRKQGLFKNQQINRIEDIKTINYATVVNILSKPLTKTDAVTAKLDAITNAA